MLLFFVLFCLIYLFFFQWFCSAFFEQKDDKKEKGIFAKWLFTFHSAIRKASSPAVLFNEVLDRYIELVNRSAGITNRIVDVVLCVDEIIKLRDREQVLNELMIPTLSTLCLPMNSDPRYWVLVTSLNPTSFQSVNIDEKIHFTGTTGSQRTIDFWRLPIPRPLDVYGLFSKYYALTTKSPEVREKRYPALSDTSEQRLNWLVTYCANHWRTLEKLYTALQVASSFQDVIEKLKTDEFLADYVKGINESLVRLALIGDYVKTDELVEGIPISQYLSGGFLFNSDPKKRTDKFILPAMTLWQLYSWSADNDVNKSGLKTLIFNMLNNPEDFIKTGKGYEKFHLQWECLWAEISPEVLPRYRMLNNSDPFSLRTRSTHKTFCQDSNPQFKITTVTQMLPDNFPTFGLILDDVIGNNGPTSDSIWNYVKSSSMPSISKVVSSAPPPTLYQNLSILSLKYSWSHERTASEMPTNLVTLANSKIGSAPEVYANLIKYLQNSKMNRISFCLVAWWRITDEKKQTMLKHLKELPDAFKPFEKQIDVIVVDANDLKISYGPTLSALRFLYEIKE